MAETVIRWRVHLRSAPDAVFRAISTPEGRASFWAESAAESGGDIQFRFANGQALEARLLSAEPPRHFAITYFGGSTVRYDLVSDGRGGTDLTMTERDVPAGEMEQNRPGWVVVLLALKAAVDFGIDLRNHDPERTWERGYVDV